MRASRRRSAVLLGFLLACGCSSSSSTPEPGDAGSPPSGAAIVDAAAIDSLAADVAITADASDRDVAVNTPDQSVGMDASVQDVASAVDASAPPADAAAVGWFFDGAAWRANGSPPACPMPLRFAPPVNFSSVTAVLYPGQVRGGNYKAHGGFLFAVGSNATVTVRAPMSGYVYRGVRYIEAGEVQYLFDVINDCGIMYRFDHLLTLSPRFAAIANMLPPAGPSSGTTQLPPGQEFVSEGEVIATAVGFANTGNSSMDWGVYDLRQKNAASNDPAWLSAHPGEQAPYALCWLDDFSAEESAALHALPGGDGQAGKMSAYCH